MSARLTAAGIPALTAEQSRARVRQRMDDCNTLAPVPEKLWGLWQKWIDGDAFWPDFTTLINGDIYHPRLFVNADYRVVAIENWADAEIGDPASDFTLYFAAAGREAMEDLIARYERAGGQTWSRMADQAEMYYWASPVQVRGLCDAHGRCLAPDEREEHGAPLCEHARGQRVRGLTPAPHHLA